MNTQTLRRSAPKGAVASTRAALLAERLEKGADALIAFAETITDAEWRVPISKTDRRPVGVIVHHVANMYPLEMDLALKLAFETPLPPVTWDDVAMINAEHAAGHQEVTKAEAIELVRRNSRTAAEALRALSDVELDRAQPSKMYDGCAVTCQFMLEDHAVRHSYHHLAKIRAALGR